MPPQADEDNVMNCKANSPEANGSIVIPAVNQGTSHQNAARRTRKRRTKETDGVATASRKLTIPTFVARKTLRKP